MRTGERGGDILEEMARMIIRMYKLYSGAGGEISLTAVEGSMESNEKLGQKGWGQLMKERVGGREGS